MLCLCIYSAGFCGDTHKSVWTTTVLLVVIVILQSSLAKFWSLLTSLLQKQAYNSDSWSFHWEIQENLRKSILFWDSDFDQNLVRTSNILPRKLRHRQNTPLCMFLEVSATLPITTQRNNPISLCREKESMTNAEHRLKRKNLNFFFDPQNV